VRIADELRAHAAYLYGDHTFWRACIAAALGQKDDAVELLREAMAQGRNSPIAVHRDPNLDPVRGYAPFEELIEPKG
jgi:hypothetical protein